MVTAVLAWHALFYCTILNTLEFLVTSYSRTCCRCRLGILQRFVNILTCVDWLLSLLHGACAQYVWNSCVCRTSGLIRSFGHASIFIEPVPATFKCYNYISCWCVRLFAYCTAPPTNLQWGCYSCVPMVFHVSSSCKGCCQRCLLLFAMQVVNEKRALENKPCFPQSKFVAIVPTEALLWVLMLPIHLLHVTPKLTRNGGTTQITQSLWSQGHGHQ